MQITLKREELLGPLGVVVGVVERRQTLPILANVMLQPERNAGLTIAATDLELEVVTKVKVEKASGDAVTVNARKLLDICRAVPEATQITLDQDGEKVKVKAGKSRFSLLTLPAADFPRVDTAEWLETVEISEGTLRALLEATQFSMAQQDVRYYLNGLLLEFAGKSLRAVATDGHRMAIASAELAATVKNERQIIVPRKGVIELIRSLTPSDGPATLRVGTNHMQVSCGDTILTAKLVDGRFPDYTKVIPSNQTKLVRIQCNELRAGLTRVAILSNEKYRGVRLSLSDDTLRMSAHNPEQEEAQEELAIDYKGDSLDIGFNVNYLIDAINALKEGDVEIGLSDPNSSCTLSAAGSDNPQYIVMPMRL